MRHTITKRDAKIITKRDNLGLKLIVEVATRRLKKCLR